MSNAQPGGAPIRVALVDDQPLFRGGIRMLVDSQPDMTFVGEASDGRQAIALAVQLKPDVILMDVRMPVLDGLEATREIVARGVESRILVLTTFDLDEAVAKAVAAGASGFVLKDADPEFLLAAIRTVRSGAEVFAAQATADLIRRFSQSPNRLGGEPEEFGTLTEREREMFFHAAKGLSNGEIAKQEYLSEATVKTHISRVLTKLDLRDRVQLVVYAYEHGLL
ncbi:DNA-binding response regulator [Pseudoclavibacter endophyticus]|uniref:Response regulator transcription factor n=1 Tax=Pseudoclavibacter endophyticus TaxID=1778590 RepID=A0A6H9WTD2_9MICO|nr:response regulator transcription factor [Pseudoclavibacter endophyticus]KAB1649945.1 response regulator transcription factor [Pseudoclavibacter endophyticus]GGA58497.1 DNA-binding response regulator [Pseudoclavibacter endophyticus]